MPDQTKSDQPRPLSPKKLAANRANAKASTGPKSEAGKATCARNATQHGLLAQSVCIEPEHREAFLNLCQDYDARFQPETAFEQTCVNQLIAADWQIHRALAIERTLFNDIASTREAGAPFDRITAAFCELQKSGQLDLLGRYRTRIERSQARAYRTLSRLQEERRGATPQNL